jgi:hypothetical protein
MYVFRDVIDISKGKIVMKNKIISKIIWGEGDLMTLSNIKTVGCLMYYDLEGCG